MLPSLFFHYVSSSWSLMKNTLECTEQPCVAFKGGVNSTVYLETIWYTAAILIYTAVSSILHFLLLIFLYCLLFIFTFLRITFFFSKFYWFRTNNLQHIAIDFFIIMKDAYIWFVMTHYSFISSTASSQTYPLSHVLK